MTVYVWWMTENMKEFELFKANQLTLIWDDGMIESSDVVMFIDWDGMRVRKGFSDDLWNLHIRGDQYSMMWLLGMYENGSETNRNLLVRRDECEDIHKCLLDKFIQYKALYGTERVFMSDCDRP